MCVYFPDYKFNAVHIHLTLAKTLNVEIVESLQDMTLGVSV